MIEPFWACCHLIPYLNESKKYCDEKSEEYNEDSVQIPILDATFGIDADKDGASPIIYIY